MIDLTEPQRVIEHPDRTESEGRRWEAVQEAAGNGDNSAAERQGPKAWQEILTKVAGVIESLVVGMALSSFVAMTHRSPKAVPVGLAGAALWSVLDRIDSPGQWHRTIASSALVSRGPRHALSLAFALAIAWETTGIGLPLLQAGTAAATALLFACIIRLALAAAAGSPRAKTAIVVGTGVVRQRVAEALAAEGVEVVAFVDDAPPDSAHGCLTRRRPLHDLPRLVRLHHVDLVAFGLSSPPDRETTEAIRACRSAGVAVGSFSPMLDGLEGRVALGRFGGAPMLSAKPWWHERRMPRVSRLIDVVVAATLLLLTLPLMVVIVGAVVIDSGRPVLYHAPRVGKRGVRFSMLKFRTMVSNSAGPFITGADDARVTRVGRVLRSTKLDELPQLWNVLRGQMALVGPRPQSPCYVALHPEAYQEILQVRPGITGIYQIKFRDEASLLKGPDFEKTYCAEFLKTKIDIDRYYVRHATLGLDLKLLAWTPLALLRKPSVSDRVATVGPWRAPEDDVAVTGVGV